ncbi:Diphthamide biosynthesis protein 3 [Cytospora paraplurivora]|uniref:Diphthamide biosynthesis protein 3 n=1 Tax=Cytospora paraplurivora TaxID=2898453 RepID=A0AAN9UIM6_9PEZI
MAEEEEISVYDEVEIEDMTYDEMMQTYYYPCPCGDRFEIALADLQDQETDIADDLPKPDQPESDTEPSDEQTAQVPVAA